MIKLGINGFGRIGRLALRIVMQKYLDRIQPVAVNTSGSMDINGWAHLFVYDSIYGKYSGEVKVEGGSMIIDGTAIPVLGQKEPAQIPWDQYGAEVVIESTGKFLDSSGAGQQLKPGVKRIVLSAE